jgi:hypothetical protein
VAPARRRVRSDFDLHSIAEPDPLDVEVSRTFAMICSVRSADRRRSLLGARDGGAA